MVYEYKQIFRHGFLFALRILLDFSYAFIAQWDKVQVRATTTEGIGQVFLKTVEEIICQIFRRPEHAVLEVTSRRAEGTLVIFRKNL